MSGPAVGLWLFEPREFGEILADVVPWLESFCEPVESKGGSDLDFWVRNGSAVGLPAWDPTGVGVFFLSEDIAPGPFTPVIGMFWALRVLPNSS
ncbi:DUF6368 family protein [Streptomyces sp. W4I9-2]|uniref:DUF6368 family protein n=1 Tax=Streptomyces sp. W4I9-2 TaxID=3042297 RepID=UPI0027D7B9D8|nr:DUF6368 family protein [Streptomyces sp. W4I9-2]